MPLFKISYLYCPKGPGKITENLLNETKKIAKREHAVFLRFEPTGKGGHCENLQELPLPYVKTRDIQPACTQILDLTKSESELLAEMKQKARYNLRLAERKGVKISGFQPPIPNKFFEQFFKLLKKTGEKQNIKLHPEEYYKKLAEFNRIFIAYYKDKPIAGAMVNFYENAATYLHGGSSDECKEVMAPYLLHWEVIKYAKSAGIRFYDWWGVDEKRWPGITKFKQGFGGKKICAPGTFDLPINKFLYFIYHYARK